MMREKSNVKISNYDIQWFREKWFSTYYLKKHSFCCFLCGFLLLFKLKESFRKDVIIIRIIIGIIMTLDGKREIGNFNQFSLVGSSSCWWVSRMDGWMDRWIDDDVKINNKKIRNYKKKNSFIFIYRKIDLFAYC